MFTKRNLIIILLFLLAMGSYYIQPGEAQNPAAQSAPAEATSAPAAPVAEAAPAAPVVAPPTVTFSIDKTSVDNGGAISVKGQGVPGKPTYLEVWSEKQVKSSFFDSRPDKDGK
ncbi:MAG: hypothetical protein Q7U40_08670, partial [Desulfatirhabdiaceae bacterium]|nr:hypothetical protein [Desulfatirhabdiaceae bacterium]